MTSASEKPLPGLHRSLFRTDRSPLTNEFEIDAIDGRFDFPVEIVRRRRAGRGKQQQRK